MVFDYTDVAFIESGVFLAISPLMALCKSPSAVASEQAAIALR